MAQNTTAGMTRSLASNPREVGVIILAALCLIAMFAVLVMTQRSANHDREYAMITAELKQLGQALAQTGVSSAAGQLPAFDFVAQTQKRMGTQVSRLVRGDPAMTPPLPSPKGADRELSHLANTWSELDASIKGLLAGRGSFESAVTAASKIQQAIPGLAATVTEISGRMAEISTPADQVLRAARQQSRLESIANGAGSVVNTGRNADIVADRTVVAANEFRETLAAIKASRAYRDERVQAPVDDAERRLRALSADLVQLRTLAPEVSQAQDAAGQLSRLGTDLASAAADADVALRSHAQSRLFKPWLVYVLASITAALLILFVFWFMRSIRDREQAINDSRQRQQQAIVKLLDEITNLADGDLTTSVTVTEDFTGAIADSINFTIETLRTLVGTINSTAVQVADAAGGTLDTVSGLNQASREQTQQITSAAETINNMTQRMQQMSSEADKLAEQAESSLETARSGGETVRRTIQGMDGLREQIQDTSKRIKRLGESSQEIGNIIEFINDIAEQTNTLALNASIQAAMAGESGKGFAVVADEVQRLAERAGTATKQIEALVKTIQADTNEAIISMERSTANVVSGAKSAEEAGGALERIEKFASDLARLIQRISGAAREQAGVAAKVAGSMQDVRNIATQTTGAADLTATRTRDLTTLSEQLRESVSGFRLPGEGSSKPRRAA